MGIFASIANGLKAIAAIFGYAQQRDAEQNSATMQANAAAKTEQTMKDAAAKAIAERNAEEIRRRLAE